ncbi:hypothetical protein T459_17023 [Capsicum annuum]|uniref:Craniofacial development protein 2-like n=1 Tax=Capsicum annuum TaxID=4072 RepID=A0A2G2ZAP3_CAPAN|nr:hypothetical protein FXO37_11885 [Capsicum annuum]PHT78971.1 hypothetical protein T459_17023 [Capsicum annuum]
MNNSWLILGNFNAMLGMNSCLNGASVHLSEITNFQQCVTNIGVGLVPKVGQQYSWSNKREAVNKIYSHIDWVFGNPIWMQRFTDLKAKYMLPKYSDYSAILVNTKVIRKAQSKSFNLITILLQQETYRKAVEITWR